MTSVAQTPTPTTREEMVSYFNSQDRSQFIRLTRTIYRGFLGLILPGVKGGMDGFPVVQFKLQETLNGPSETDLVVGVFDGVISFPLLVGA